MKLMQFASTLALIAALSVSPSISTAQPTPPSVPSAHATAAAPIEQRPNVLVWMIDDVGFAQLSCFGGLIETPNIDRVARMGLRYANYHTTPICSASRAAFLTGRNPHSVHVGGHAAAARPYPGYDAYIPASDGTLAANLHEAGYVTYALGKWDHLPIAEQSSSGPYMHWPLGQGFDRFYGFLWAETDNWRPTMTQDNAPIATPSSPDYHLNHDLADHAIAMIDARQTNAAPPPFFMYWATGAAHAPHHAPASWIEHYRGRFDMGWDVARAQILAREKARHLVAANATLAPRPDGMPAWSALNADERRLYARQMEVFAASLSYADAEFGRILDALQANGELDNTIVVITSDNGASGEGAYSGTFNESTFVNGHVATAAENMPFLDRWGGPETAPHYSFGWAVAGNTPFRYYKQTTFEGGTHVPFVIAWPHGIAARGQVRTQFAYVTDVAPTILEAAGAPLAPTINNVAQSQLEGRSLVASFSNPADHSTARSQYSEMYGNKGLWSPDGWAIVTTHRTNTWNMSETNPPNEPWELYNLNADPAETHNLAARYPERVAQMGAEFDRQADLYHVNPIGNISEGVQNGARFAQAEFSRRGGIWRYAEPVAHIMPQAAPPVLALGFHFSVDVSFAQTDATGPIFSSGADLGGVGFYLKAGRPIFIMRSSDGGEARIESPSALTRGTTHLELVVAHVRGADGSPDQIEATIVANGHTLTDQTVRFSASPMMNETFDVGGDDGRPLTADYTVGARFPGQLHNIVFDFSAALARR